MEGAPQYLWICSIRTVYALLTGHAGSWQEKPGFNVEGKLTLGCARSRRHWLNTRGISDKGIRFTLGTLSRTPYSAREVLKVTPDTSQHCFCKARNHVLAKRGRGRRKQNWASSAGLSRRGRGLSQWTPLASTFLMANLVPTRVQGWAWRQGELLI